jgi:hypothetical protein
MGSRTLGSGRSFAHHEQRIIVVEREGFAGRTLLMGPRKNLFKKRLPVTSNGVVCLRIETDLGQA